jgi:hypothetical protein
MLLMYHCRLRKVPEYGCLPKQLQASKLPSEKGLTEYSDSYGPGVYVDDVVKWLLHNGFIFTACYQQGMRPNVQTVLELLDHSPVMVGMNWHVVGHWIVLADIEKEYLRVLDPLRLSSNPRRRRISSDTFRKKWDGSAVAIIGTY